MRSEYELPMILKIRHLSRYQYNEKVFLEPHHLYLYPSQRSYFKLKDFKLNINPQYSGLSQRLDEENNVFYQCWFNEKLEFLEVESQMEFEISEYNPFNFLIEEIRNPKISLLTYLEKENLSKELIVWSKDFNYQRESPLSILTELCLEIKEQWAHEIRFESNLLSPDNCFERKSGSCRDLSWMLIQILRNKGIPARFVSGYSFNPELEEGHELHAWVEAWIDGAGWIGLDPSAGILCTHMYIPLASSYRPEFTSPIQGTFRGPFESNFEYEVKLELL